MSASDINMACGHVPAFRGDARNPNTVSKVL